MARPSVKEKRTEEILDAFERCVARYGVEGSTLEKIAEQAGLRRSLLRHYIGNREELIEALLERFISRSNTVMAQMTTLLEDASAAKFIEYLFYEEDGDTSALVSQALIVAAAEHENIRIQMTEWGAQFTAQLSNIISGIYPTISEADLNEIATGIEGIYFNYASFAVLGKSEKMKKASIGAALRLLKTIEN